MSDHRPVPDNVWRLNMGDMPMPEGCTFDMMNAMYDVVSKLEDREYSAQQLKWYEGLWREWKPKYDRVEKLIDDGDEFVKQFQDLTAIMRLIKEGIILYRGRLSE